MDRRLGQVVSQAELVSRRGGWKRNGQVVVCASGAFDLLHPGHVRFLEQALSLGDVLVVAVASDAQVRQTLSSSLAPSSNVTRPVTPAAERAEIVAALACVDCAVELDGPLEQFLEFLAPEIFVEGSSQDAPGTIPPPRPHPAAPGLKLVRIPPEPSYSTAGLIEHIRQLRK